MKKQVKPLPQRLLTLIPVHRVHTILSQSKQPPLPSPKGETKAKQPNAASTTGCGFGFGFPFRGRKGRLLGLREFGMNLKKRSANH
jgi:hypothetical protein